MANKKAKQPAIKKSSSASRSSASFNKRTGVKKSPAKKALTDKEKEMKEANVLANLDNRKKPGSKRPKKKASTKETSDLLSAVIEGMKERKVKNITVVDLKNIENRVTDFFVICDADSNIHVGSIGDSVEETVEKLTGERAFHTEGRQNGEWILIDYINIVVHVFQREFREHYNLEGLWGDAEITTINN